MGRRIGFPYMGTSPLALKMILEDLGHEPVVPTRPTKKTLSLGVKFAPEFACLPLKITLGTMIEVLDRGAEVIVTSGGVGPCRAGQYAQIQEAILKRLGYDFKMIVLEPPRKDILGFARHLHFLKGRRSWLTLWNVIKRGYRKIQALDQVEQALHRTRPRELSRGDADRAFTRALTVIDGARSGDEIEEARLQGLALMNAVPQDRDLDPLRIGIVGEIYVVLEPSSNLNIERHLGELGVEVHRSIFLTGWTQDNAIVEGGGHSVKKAAQPYLPEMIGGHGQDSVGHTVIYAQEGMDGVIQLGPFTCIPEIVAKGILPQVSKDWDIPVFSVFLDEQTGEAGLRTRLEAFVDLLARRRAARQNGGDLAV